MRKDLEWLGIASLTLAGVACGDDGAGAGGGGTTSASTGSPTSTSSSGDGGGGSGPVGSGGAGGVGGAGGAGGGPNLDKDPATVTDPEDCWFEGGGGDILRACTTARIDLSEEIPLEELTISIEASDGTVFESVGLSGYPLDEVPDEPSFFATDPATALYLRNVPGGGDANLHYAPEWLDVEVRRDGVLVGAERFEPLEYACRAESNYHFCWGSEPVTLDITNPE